MVRHTLTPKERLEGVKKALRNPKTPKQFRAGLEQQKRVLEHAIAKGER